ncbi:nucleotidyltransferase [Thermoplasmatales archaeon ex4572_165]|nr:MAG: nucleotidyltransferase [Thermoplasmatales archaeon ex4572_165]
MKNDPLSKKTYVFGKKSEDKNGLLSIGKFYALDGSYGKNVYLDAKYPHIISIFGKRGYGKSYTMGVFIEEIANLDTEIKNDLSVIIIDTLGIYWTMKYPNKKEEDILDKWDLKPDAIDINVYRPKISDVKDDEITDDFLSIPAYLLSADVWCQLFDVKPTSSFGIALIQAINNLKEKYLDFSLEEIFDEIKNNVAHTKEIKNIAENFYHYARSLGIFSNEESCIERIFKPGSINIIDISNLPGIHLKQMITGIISELIFQKRVLARRLEEIDQMKKQKNSDYVPKIWMAIDEAQIFLPKHMDHYSKTVLIEHWLRQGRQPGLSLILATQQPSAIDQEVFSHSDLVFCHRLTSQHDIKALHQIRPSYMHENIESIIEKMGHEKGVCNIIDDTMEQAHICKIRPRKTWHGGNEPKITKHINIK